MYDIDKFEHTVGKEIVNELTFSECKDRLKEYLWKKYDKFEIFENPSVIVENMEEASVRKTLIVFIDEEESNFLDMQKLTILFDIATNCNYDATFKKKVIK